MWQALMVKRVLTESVREEPDEIDVRFLRYLSIYRPMRG